MRNSFILDPTKFSCCHFNEIPLFRLSVKQKQINQGESDKTHQCSNYFGYSCCQPHESGTAVVCCVCELKVSD